MKISDPKLLAEFRQRRCEVCGRQPPSQVHHWYARGMGGASRLDVPINLIALCIRCHASAEAGNISRDKILAMIARRQMLPADQVREEIYRLARLPKGSSCEST